MKTQLLFPALIFGLFLFYSCDPNEIGTNGNYWSSSTLVRMQLKGKVKKIERQDEVINFNQDGFMTSSVYSRTGNTSTTTYNYDGSGKLMSIDFSATEGNISYSTNYTYDTHGKYVVTSPFHIYMSGLTPNLKSVATPYSSTEYKFNGNSLLIITTSISASSTYIDTTEVLYDGKYPSSITRTGSFVKDMTFASNGMFKTYTEGFTGEGYHNESRYFFKTDDEYLLVDSIGHYTLTNNVMVHSKSTYTYDSKKNVTREETPYSIMEHEYTYDSHGNWTTMVTRSKQVGAANWENTTTENRTIEYW